ncbi:hypothetical protein niasHS_016746 [Heterodera schachtii]|uniref:ATP-dependent DNA helicase n=1 Tax=Heterodera schachtii TaxID=97005 RepID=A0ABD2HTC7_HETSC
MGAIETGCYCSDDNASADTMHSDELEQSAICKTSNSPYVRLLPIPRGRFGGRSSRVEHSGLTLSSQMSTSKQSQQTLDSILMPPPSLIPRRTSSRISHAPTLFSTPTSSRHSIKPVTSHCASLNHRCAHCNALLLPSEFKMEGGYPKCCAKGHVNLRVRFDDLQKWPTKLIALFNNQDTTTIRWIGKLRANAMAYNDSLAFGCVRIQRDDNLKQGYRIVKCNNMIRYVLWDFNPPTPDLPHLQGQLFTIPDADARLRIDEIAQERHLDEELLNFLHGILREHHPFADLYKTASETFKNLEDADKINFRMLVVDTNKKGIERSVDKSLAIEEIQERQIREIHPGRINVETAAGSKLVAEFYFDNGANVPPGQKYDIVLQGKHGTGEHDMKWWNRNVEPTIFPLLFSRGQFAYEYGIKLKLAEKERFDTTYRQIRDADGDLMDDTELGEEAEFLPPELERRIHRRDNVSRAQWFRYMCQIRDHDWKSSHWLWNWNNLAQLYTISYNNRIEAQKVQYMKQLQGQKRLVRVPALLQWVQQIRNNKGLKGPIGQIFMTDAHFRGSRQFYQKEYANCMTICREIGKPDLLITFTMDPECEELDNLLPIGPDGKRQQWHDRPDIVCRLFIDKRDELLNDLTKKMVLGYVTAWFFSLEFQLRGLPHIHVCLTLDWERIRLHGVIQSPEDYMSEYICAEIPSLPESGRRTEEAKRMRELYKTITTKHIHTCSAQRCLVDGKCKKHFPKPFSYDYVYSENAYPRYLRRPPAPNESALKKHPQRYGNTFKTNGPKGQSNIDNSYVIPYNKFLSAKFKSHINVEFVAGDGCTKYVCKYVMKGADMCFVQVSKEGFDEKALRYDEFHQIRLTRHITSVEAFMSIYGVPLVQRSHKVTELDVHGPEGHRIAIEEGEEEEAAIAEEKRVERGDERTTQLTSYFTFNRKRKIDGEASLKLTYATCFKKLFYDLQKREWKPYIQHELAGQTLCRLKTVSPSNLELLAIRQLLFAVEDPTDWNDLRTFNERLHNTFIDAAKARGLMVDNILWKNTIIEAFETKKTARQCIRWLAVFFATANLTSPTELLDEILQMPNNWLVNTRVAGASLEDRRQYVLRALEWFLREHGVEPDDQPRTDGTFETACEHIGLPRPPNINIGQEEYIALQFNRDDVINAHLEPELRDPELFNNDMKQRYHKLFTNGPKPNDEQQSLIQEVHKAIIDAASVIDGHKTQFNSAVPRLFMVTGEGGAGKTFTYNSNGFTFMPTATTGIAAELLYEGQTVHKRICRRKHVNSSTPINLDYDSRFAELLRRTHGILIDEISMQHKDVLEYVDKLLRSIAPSEYLRNTPFAGKVVVLGGDWKQLAPVVPGGGHLDQLNASVKNSQLFSNFVTRKLLANHRLRPGQENYRNFLLRVGTGKNNTDHRVQLKPSMCVATRSELLDFVFTKEMLEHPLDHEEQFGGCAILSPLNSETFELNNIIMVLNQQISVNLKFLLKNQIVGDERIYTATTQPVRDETGQTELLNVVADADCENLTRLTPQGVPEHRLRIKIGAIMMVIKNISIADGLCNGTRVQVLPGPKGRLMKHIIRCRILTGNKRGHEHDLHPARFVFGGDPEAVHQGPIKCERIQFPLRPGSVMTINKSQGQTLQRVGVLLDQSQCFSHGQLYVALSRVKDEADIRICTKHLHHKVKNVVMQELLDPQDIENVQNMLKDDPTSKNESGSDSGTEMDVDYGSLCVPQTPSSNHLEKTIFRSQLDLNTAVTRLDLAKIKVVKGDITRQKVDMIVNAANPQLRRGGGVDDAIHRACQPDMAALEKALKTLHMSNGCDFPAGCVVVTDTFGDLKMNSKYIAHAIGPAVQVLPPTDTQITNLKLCYERALDALIEKKGKTIAFPSISTGAFNFPRDIASKTAMEAVLNWLSTNQQADQVEEILFVYFRRHEAQMGTDLIGLAKRHIPSRSATSSHASTPKTSRARIPLRTTLTSDIRERLTLKGSQISEQAIETPKLDPAPSTSIAQPLCVASCHDVIGDGDCFYRAISYAMTRVDLISNSDELRKAASRTLLAIINNTNFYPRNRHPTHADFVDDLRKALLTTPSTTWHDQSVANYAQYIKTAARGQGGTRGWAQFADAHALAILFRRPIVIVRPSAFPHELQGLVTSWDDPTLPKLMTAFFPDGESIFDQFNVSFSELNNFTIEHQIPGRHNRIQRRAVQNPVVIWYNGTNHFQAIVFNPISSAATQGMEFINSDPVVVPPDFLTNVGEQQQNDQ